MQDKLWRRLCGSYETWTIYGSFNAVLLALLIYAFVFGDMDTGSFVVAMMTLVVILVNFVLFAILWVKCKRFQEKYERSLDQL